VKRISPVEVLYKHENSAVLQAAEKKNYLGGFFIFGIFLSTFTQAGTAIKVKIVEYEI
jgi:hypothetical protein